MSIIDALNPESIAAKVGVLAVACAAVFAIGHHVGYKGEKAVYDVYVAKQAAIAEKQVADNAKGLADNKAQYDANLANIQKDRDAKIKSLQGEYDSAIADRNKSDDRLRKYLSRTGIPVAQVPGAASGTGGASAEGQSDGGFSDGVSSLNWYLIQRFHLADENAVKLNEAIDVINQDRLSCNGSLPGVSTQ